MKQLHKRLHKTACLTLILITLFCSFASTFSIAASGDTTYINVIADYNQTSAKSQLPLINDFRAGPEAEWFTDDTMGPTYTPTYPSAEIEALGKNNLALKIDPDLEKIAMQRAAEISILFAHTRPDGTKYTTAYDEIAPNKFRRMGENIAAGTDMDMETAFNAWKEDDLPYSGQGHRRNMLGENYTRIGIAYCKIDGIDYWVQEFGTCFDESVDPGMYVPSDGKRKVVIRLSDDLMSGDPNDPDPPKADPPAQEEVEVEYDSTIDPPFALLTYSSPGALGTGSFTGNQPFVLSPNAAGAAELPDAIDLPNGDRLRKDKMVSNLECDYKSDDTSTVEVYDDGKLYGKKLGEAEVTISSDKYKITDSFIVKVVPRDLKDADVFLEETSFEFCGRGIEPEPVVHLGIAELKKGVDYTLTYSDNRNVGNKATVTVNGTGNYKGTASTTFEITPLSMTDAEIELEYYTTHYTGSERKPHVVSMETDKYEFEVQASSNPSGPSNLKAGGKTTIPVIEGEDFEVIYKNNIPVGTATATARGTGNLIGDSKPKNFEITKATNNDVTAKLEYTTTEYTGSEKKPKVTVTIDGDELKEGTDFTATYSSNTDIGTASVKVKGKGDFDYVDKDLTFEITKRSIKDAEVTPEYTTKEYTGSELKPKVTVKIDGKTLKEGEDYTVTYSDNKNAGTAKITVTGKGNYKDSADATFTITAPCEHSWDSGKVTTPATCTAKGVMTYTCTKCGETKTEDIPLASHTPGPEATCGSPQKCTVCGKTLVAAAGDHVDSNLDGKCDVCGASVALPTPNTNENNGSSNGSGSGSSSPKTGDDMTPTTLAVTLTIFISSALCMTILLIRRAYVGKKRRARFNR